MATITYQRFQMMITSDSPSLPPVRISQTLARDIVLFWDVTLRSVNEADLKHIEMQDPLEKERVTRISNDRLKARYILNRWILRQVLSRYSGVEPADVPIVVGKNGKPGLDPLRNPLRIEFNLSHTQDRLLIGLTRDRAIGVDIEAVNEGTPSREIAKKFFHESEAELIHGLNEPDKSNAFFRIWTCKEAIVKALGTGMFQHMKAVEIELPSHDNARIRSLPVEAGSPAEWHLKELGELGNNMIGAIALSPMKSRC